MSALDSTTGYPLFEEPESDEPCWCDEDKICDPCMVILTRRTIQAGLNAVGARFAQLSAAPNATAVLDELLIDAAIQDRLETSRGFRATPAKRSAQRQEAEPIDIRRRA